MAAQVSGTARGARGLAIAVLGVSFLLRGIGDSGGSHGLTWLTWLSPIGWAELVRPFTGERWWVLALPVPAAAWPGPALAFALAARRDQGAGLMQPGPARRDARAGCCAGPVGLAWRLQRGSAGGLGGRFLAGGLAIGVVAKGIGKLIGSSAGIDARRSSKIGGQAALTNAYLAACMSLLGLVAAAYAVSARRCGCGPMRAADRAEPILAAPIEPAALGRQLPAGRGGSARRCCWWPAASASGSRTASPARRSSTQVPRLLGAGLAQLPAALAVAAVGAAFVGLLPTWSGPAGWTALAVCGLIALFGPALNLSQAVLDISPFAHVPKLPGGVFSVVPLAWLSACRAGAGRRGPGRAAPPRPRLTR